MLFSIIVANPFFATASEHDYIDPVTGMEFLLIKGGTFDMGDLKRKDLLAVPPHKVTVADFYIGKYEVTFEQYDKFCDETKREKPSDEGWGRGNRPVINVSWDDAVEFANWLSGKTGHVFRLPSESEWEYAARGGRSTPYWWGYDPAKNVANCSDCGSTWDNTSTTPVGSFSPNPYGLFDMTGNVYEWCLDYKNETYEGAPQDGSAWQQGASSHRITRSGSWRQSIIETRSFARCWELKEDRKEDVGFRLVREP